MLIAFSKSVLATIAKKPSAKLPHIPKQYKNNNIVHEFVDGKGKPSVTTDVYSLAFLSKYVYKFFDVDISITT